MTTVAIIPARGQSKQIPHKNLRLLGGLPLISYTIGAAHDSRLVDRVVVSTDHPKIARVAIEAGAEVPFRRPEELSTDHASSVDVVVHAIRFLEHEVGRIDEVVTLQPTSPFRTGKHIDAAISLMRQREADSAVSVASMGVPVSVLGYLIDDGLFITLASNTDSRRQSSPAAYRLTGGIYVSRRELLDGGRLTGRSPVALELGGAAALDIDTFEELSLARRIAMQLKHQ